MLAIERRRSEADCESALWYRLCVCDCSQLLKRSQRLRVNNAYITPAAFNMRSAHITIDPTTATVCCHLSAAL